MPELAEKLLAVSLMVVWFSLLGVLLTVGMWMTLDFFWRKGSNNDK